MKSPRVVQNDEMKGEKKDTYIVYVSDCLYISDHLFNVF